MVRIIIATWLFLGGWIASGVRAQEAPMPDKSGCDLFHPVPDGSLRELSPDRPDKTESPYTVDAGHSMLEMDFANFTYDKTGGTTMKAWNAGDFNFKAGLLDNMDIQFLYDNYLDVRTEATLRQINHAVGFW